MSNMDELQILTGHQCVLQALRHRRRALYRMWLSRRSGSQELNNAARDFGLTVRRADSEDLNRIAGNAKHQGVALECGPLPVHTLDEILRFQPPDGNDLLVFLVGVEDPRNLGAVARCCSFLGARAMILPGKGSGPLSPAASRTSAGALESLPVAVVPGAVAACGDLGSAGFQVTGVELEGDDLWEWKDTGGKVVLVLGGEDRGLGRRLKDACDRIVSIPGNAPVGSLNVSVAAGIALFHVKAGRRPLEPLKNT